MFHPLNGLSQSKLFLLGLLILILVPAAGVGCSKSQAQPPAEMILIPAGEFKMGSDRVDTEGRGTEFGSVKPWYMDEHPLHRVFSPAYYIDKYEVTNARYKKFVDSTVSRPPESWPGGKFPSGRENYPVSFVNWYEAQRYCRWLGKRLPTEAEWEKASRGTDGREYPWGNDFDGKKANTGDAGLGDFAPVGSFEAGKSPYGVYDMSGNVWEWTTDWYQPYPGNTYHSDAFGQKFKVLRGGSWGGPGHYALPLFYRTSYRLYAPPEDAYPDAGFRCVKSVSE